MFFINFKKNKKKFLLILFLFFSPFITHAFVFDGATTALEGLSEIVGPFVAFWVFVYIFYLISYGLFLISAFLLQEIINFTPTLLTVMSDTGTGTAVRLCWEFVAGIANTLLIIGFISIAICIVLGIESYGIKKSLPKLIAVALLINFTLLFVGAGIDISNIAFNSIANKFTTEKKVDYEEESWRNEKLEAEIRDKYQTDAGFDDEVMWRNKILEEQYGVKNSSKEEKGNILIEGLLPLIKNGDDFTTTNSVFLSGIVLSFAIPWSNTVAQIAFVIHFLSNFSLFLETVLRSILFFLFAFVFFLMFSIFLMRIFIIQLLAIISPLAIFSLIFKDSKKYFDSWLNALVEWLFVGVIFIFLLYVGIAFAPAAGAVFVLPKENYIPSWLLFISNSGIFSYFVLFIYLIVLLGFLRKITPSFAKMAISQVKGGIRAISPYAGGLLKGGTFHYQKKLAENEGFQKKMNEWTESAEGQRGLTKNLKRAFGVNLGKNLVNNVGVKMDKKVEKYTGTSAQQKAVNILNSVVDKPETLLANLLASHKDEDLGDLIKALPENYLEDNFANLYKKAKATGKVKNLRKMLPVDTLLQETAGLSEIERQEKIVSFIGKANTGDIRKMSSVLLEGTKSKNKKKKNIAQTIINTMTLNPEHRRQQLAFIGEAGYDAIPPIKIALETYAKSSKKEEMKKFQGQGHSFEEKDYREIYKNIDPVTAKTIGTMPGFNIFLAQNDSISTDHSNINIKEGISLFENESAVILVKEIIRSSTMSGFWQIKKGEIILGEKDSIKNGTVFIIREARRSEAKTNGRIISTPSWNENIVTMTIKIEIDISEIRVGDLLYIIKE